MNTSLRKQKTYSSCSHTSDVAVPELALLLRHCGAPRRASGANEGVRKGLRKGIRKGVRKSVWIRYESIRLTNLQKLQQIHNLQKCKI